MKTVWVPVTSHGHYLMEEAEDPVGILVGFHGYGESASENLAAIRSIPGARRWTCVSIHALNLFYRNRGESVVGSWMTRAGREYAIEDNRAYVTSVLESVRTLSSGPLVIAGFSQGASMAARAAAAFPGTAALILLAGDIPPDVDCARLPRVLLGRGTEDAWYTQEKMQVDVARLGERSIEVEPVVFSGGHEWNPVFLDAAGDFLIRVANPAIPPI